MSRILSRSAVIFLVVATTATACAPARHASTRGPLMTVAARDANAFGGAPAVDIPDDAKAMGAFLKAEVSLNNGDRTDALNQLEQAVKYDPNNAELRVQLGTMYVRSGKLKDALEQVNHAISIKPNDPEALLLAAGINSALGNDNLAEQDYKAVLRTDPKNQDAYLYLGTLYAKRNDYAQAEKTFQRLIALDPNSFLAYYYAGRLMIAAKNYPAAEKYYDHALTLNPQSELVLMDIAMLREIEGKNKEAEDYYNKVLQLNPNNQSALKLLAQLHVGQKNYNRALDDLKKLEGLETNPADTRYKMGLVYLEHGDPESVARAVTEFNLVIGAEPDNFKAHYYLGVAYTELNETDKATTEFKNIPQDSDHYIESRLQLAYIYDKASHYDDAIGALNEALKKRPNDTEIMGFIGGVYAEKKDYPDAIAIARKMVAIDGKNDKFHFSLGAYLDESGQKVESVGEMKKAIQLNPQNAQALNYLGYTYADQGRNLDEAEQLVKRALDIEPEDGFYIDSLGWVYYQKGDYKRAVEQLERAVNLTGNDPTITEHLGDAYKKLGKLRQASHEYNDALRKAQETGQEARLKDKLQALQASVSGNPASLAH